MNFSKITDDFFIGSMPTVNHNDQLHELGVRLIINMRFSLGPQPDPNQTPIHTLWLRSFDNPFFPISIQKLMQGAQAALATIHNGGKVYAHCAYGRHRGVAMGVHYVSDVVAGALVGVVFALIFLQAHEPFFMWVTSLIGFPMR